jgi:hypothetical protein
VPGSVPYNYLYFVNQLTRSDGIKTSEDQAMFDKFTKTNKSSPEALQLKLWNLLRRFDATKDEAERKVILDTLCEDYLAFNFDHKKPQLRDGLKIEHDESSQEEVESRHTISADFFDFSNEKLIETEAEELRKNLERIGHNTNPEQLKSQVREATAQFLSRLL